MKNLITYILFALFLVSARTLEVGIYQNGPKISFDEDGNAQGIFADVLNETANNENWQINYHTGTWDDQIKALESGKIDILVDVAYSEDRAMKFKINNIQIIEDWLEVYCLKNLNITSVKDLDGKRIAVLNSSIQEDFLQNEIKQKFGINFTLLVYTDYSETQNSVLTGTADLMIASRFFYYSDKRDKGIEPKHVIFRPSGSYFAFSQKIDNQVIEALDKNLIKMKNTPKSAYYKSLEYWLEKRHQNILITYFYYILAILAAIVILLWIFNQLLKKSVKAKTAELQESERHVEAMLELNPDLIFILDRNGVYLDCHTSSTLLLHAPWHELAGKNIRNVLPADIATGLLLKFEQTIITRELLVYKYALTIRTKKHFFEARILAFEKDKIMVIARDETEKSILEEKLRLSQKMEAIGVLAAGIAHEISSPIQYIMNNTKFLQDYTQELLKQLNSIKYYTFSNHCSECSKLKQQIQTLDIEFLCSEIPKSLDGTLVGIDKIHTIVAALKDFYYPRNHAVSNTDINKALDYVITITSGNWMNQAFIEKSFDQDLPLIPCFADKMNQVFINLIVNAVDSINEKKIKNGLIKITTSQSKESVLISFSDNGLGISDEIKDKIFEPFFTTKEVGKGTGQGLFIVYDIIYNLHKGTIEVNSEVGKGTEIIIKLPNKQEEQHA